MLMKSKIKNTSRQFETFIGVDLGDRKHHLCVTDKNGVILKECTISNDRSSLTQLCKDYPNAAVALEVGAHSPWISRFLAAAGMRVTVANARKLRAIYQNDRKCDRLDAQMLAKLLRADPDLLSPIQHGSEQAQKDLVAIKVRASLVRQRTSMVNTLRGVVKSMGLRIPSSSSEAFHFMTTNRNLTCSRVHDRDSLQDCGWKHDSVVHHDTQTENLNSHDTDETLAK